MVKRKQDAGTVSIVGAGPGDPGLLTVRAAQRLQEAEVVVYDHLVTDAILSLIGSSAERIYAGKWAGERAMSQEAIQDLLVLHANKGKRVVRLKGGDVFLFGRGGEEGTRLRSEGIPFEVVPGVTSALAVPAYAGIPVTDRRMSSSLMVLTGHEDPTREIQRTQWERAAHAADTLVVLMGTRRLADICQALLAAGKDPSCPAAVISWGTTGKQKTYTAPLDQLANVASAARPPSVIVIGEVVRMRENLAWFEDSPLFGARILVTRSAHQEGPLRRALDGLGAGCVSIPVLEVTSHVTPEEILGLERAWNEADWVLFTSRNAVHVLDHFSERSDLPHSPKIGVVGPGTAAEVRKRGFGVDCIPATHNASALAETLREKHGVGEGTRVLFLRGSTAKETLPECLEASGARVESPVVYTVKPVAGAPWKECVSNQEVDLAVLTSAYSVRAYVEGCDDASRIPVFVMSESIAEVARDLGLQVAGVAPTTDLDGVVAGLVEWGLGRGTS